MLVAEVERLVAERYSKHGLDLRDPVSPWALARLELGRDGIETHRRLVGGSHAYVRKGRWKIAISAKLSVEYAAHAVGHELGHATFAQLGIRFASRAEEERAADLYGAVVLAPGDAVRTFHERHGLRPKALARFVVSTPTWAALRFAEALCIAAVVVSPTVVRVRGPEGYDWPAPSTLRAIATAGVRGVRHDLGPARVAWFPGF